jgi:hypothetical protein
MSQVDMPRAVPRSGKVAATLACVVLIGAGFGFVLGRWSANWNAELVETGEIRPLALDAEIEVRYPRPYGSLPYLRVEEPIISYEMVQQTPEGFRIRIKNFYANFDKAGYTARGFP